MSVVTAFCEEIPPPGETAIMVASEFHHAVRVRRVRRGEAIRLIDGRGVVGMGIVLGHDPGLVVEVRQRRTQAAPKLRIHVAAALPKGDRQVTLLDMLTQLGVSAFTPLNSERSVVHAGARALRRWRRVCVEACKQSGNAYLPELHEASSLAQAVAFMRARGAVCYLAHPEGSSQTPTYPAQGRLGLLVGPEGGFSDAEVQDALANGVTPVALGPHVLRIETAAAAWVAALRLRPEAARPTP